MVYGINETDFTFESKQAEKHDKAIAFPNKLKKIGKWYLLSKRTWKRL